MSLMLLESYSLRVSGDMGVRGKRGVGKVFCLIHGDVSYDLHEPV